MLVLDRVPGASDPITALFDEVGVPWEAWDADEIAARLPHLDPGAYGPPAPVTSDAFFADAHGSLTGSFTPDAGYVADPALAAHNLGAAAVRQRRERAAPPPRSSPSRRRARGAGGSPSTSGDTCDADVVVNAAGPWSAQVNALAGVGADFTVTTRPMRQEVHELAAPVGSERGPDHRRRPRPRHLLAARRSRQAARRRHGAGVRPAGVARRPRRTSTLARRRRSSRLRCCGPPAGSPTSRCRTGRSASPASTT